MLLWVISLFLIIVIYGFTCNNDYDCELLGSCVDNTCQCKPGFTGLTCGTINLAYAPNPYYGIWPLKDTHDNETCYAWGFSIVYNKKTNMYNGIVNQGCYNLSDPNQPMVSGAFLINVESEYPYGTFEYVNTVYAPSTFNPHIIYDPFEEVYLLFYRTNELTPYPICIGDGMNYGNGTSNLTAFSMDIGVTKDINSGEWTNYVITIDNMPETHASNPSCIILSNGSYVMAYRFNTNNEYVGIAISHNSYIGPYYNIANLSTPGEDPFIWEDINDNTFHIIFHVENGQAYKSWPSLHAYSNDLYNWNVSKSFDLYGKGAYSTNVTWDNGDITSFYRRERPQLLFDTNTGHPLYLYTANQENKKPNETHFGYSYSVVQFVSLS